MSVVAVLVEVCFDRDWLDFPCFHELRRNKNLGRLTEHSLLQRISTTFAKAGNRCANYSSRRRTVPLKVSGAMTSPPIPVSQEVLE